MKKHLVAFLSMIGLAGAAAPAQGQVLKGSDEQSRKESQIKHSKQTAEKNATNAQVQDKRKDKWAKADAENKAVKTDLQNKAAKNETWVKGGKNAAEYKAAKDQSNLKLKQETLKNQNATTNQQKNALTKGALTKAALTKAKDAEQK